GQIAHVFAPGAQHRTANMMPLVFSPHDPHTLYLGTQYAMVTKDGGEHWRAISPDLTERGTPTGSSTTSSAGGSPTDSRPPSPVRAIAALSPSPIRHDAIWAGTTNGIIQATDDGLAWREVTPKDIPGPASINSIEAGRHDAGSAYAAVSVPNDVRPY